RGTRFAAGGPSMTLTRPRARISHVASRVPGPPCGTAPWAFSKLRPSTAAPWPSRGRCPPRPPKALRPSSAAATPRRPWRRGGRAESFLGAFLELYARHTDGEVWFFPPAISFTTVLDLVRGRPDLGAGVQNVHWEPKGAFTGELSVTMLVEAGAKGAIVGHSERRHVFGEKDEESGKKARALLDAGLVPVFCVGEKLEEREAGKTRAVVQRQLSVLDGLPAHQLDQLVGAYEPV